MYEIQQIDINALNDAKMKQSIIDLPFRSPAFLYPFPLAETNKSHSEYLQAQLIIEVNNIGV